MTIRSSIIAALIACTGLLHAADPDETHFKPKAYSPRKTLNDASYRASTYVPLDTSHPVGKALEDPSRFSRWNFFKSRKTAAEFKQAPDARLTDADAYTQQKHISVPTIKADPRDVPDKKPFKESVKKVGDATFTPEEKPQGKNPLLKPRQGIKEPE